MTNPALLVLGSAQDGGVPHVGCHCATCTAARRDGTGRRMAASLAVVDRSGSDWVLIDATPFFPEQIELVANLVPGAGLPSAIVLTHAHVGHYPGLMYLGREAINTRGIPVYADSSMCAFLRGNGPWSQLVALGNVELREIRAGEPFLPAGSSAVELTPIEVPHRNEFALTHAYELRGPRRSVLYIPDIDRWEQLAPSIEERAAAFDLCILDATFYDRRELAERGLDYGEIPHPLAVDTIERLGPLVASGDTEVLLTHLNHTNRALRPDDPAAAEIASRGFAVAEEGRACVL